MKSNIVGLNWSKWKSLYGNEKITYLHNWNGNTHPEYHNASIVYSNGVYHAEVLAGSYGETGYLREKFSTAKQARMKVEKACQIALESNDLKV